MGGGDLNASLVVHRTVLTVLEASGLLKKYPCRRRARFTFNCSSPRSSQGSRTLCRPSGMLRLVSEGRHTAEVQIRAA